MIRRTHLLRILIILVAMLVLATACGQAEVAPTETPTEEPQSPDTDEDVSDGESSDGEAETDSDTITIGILAPFTGPLSAAAQDSMDGWELFWELRGNTEVAGKTIEWETADTANDAATGITQAKSLIEQHGAEFVVGPFTTAVGVGVAEEIGRRGIPQFVPILSADSITQRKKPDLPYVVRIAGWSASQVTHPFGQWVYDEGYRDIATICFDLEFGYEHCGGFVNTFTDAGGEIGLQTWAPLTTEDYSPFIAQLQQADPEAVFVGLSGIGAVRFVEQWDEFGLKDEIPLLTTETVVDQSALRSMDDSALGIISAGHFAEGRDNPETQEFVDAYLEAYGHLPSYFSAAMYTAADWLVMALEEMDGEISDKDAFIEVVRAVELEDSALGPQRLDEYDHPLQNIYIREVTQRDDDLLWNEVIHTFEDVNQFWTYDPEAFMSEPAYSREYQGQ